MLIKCVWTKSVIKCLWTKCVWTKCWRAGGGGGGGGGARDTESKTRTPHKDVPKQTERRNMPEGPPLCMQMTHFTSLTSCCGCEFVPRLPRETTVDVRLCHACHVK